MLKYKPQLLFPARWRRATHCVAYRDPNIKIHIWYFSSGILALLHAHCFLIEHPQKANSSSSHCQKPKASTQKYSKLSGKLDHLFPTGYQYNPWLETGLWVLASRVIGNTPEALLVCCHMLYIVFVTSDGQSPLYKIKSFNEGQIIEALSGRSPLYVTKSSGEGQFMMT